MVKLLNRENIEEIVFSIKDIQKIQEKTGLTYDQVLNTCKMVNEHNHKKELERVLEDCFGVTDSNNSPRFLEAIAMQLGYK